MQKQSYDHSGDSVHRTSKNMRARSRVLVFLLLAGAVARLENHQSVQVFENGIGALNLPYQADDPKRQSHGVRPRTILRAMEFLNSVTGQEMWIKHPHLLRTKGAMRKRVQTIPGLDLNMFISCDRHVRKLGVRHCGWCSSCVLRRVSDISVGGGDVADMEFVDAMGTVKPHIFQMHSQVVTLRWCLAQKDAWSHLTAAYPLLHRASNDVALLHQRDLPSVREDMVTLIGDYVDEWSQSLPYIVQNEPTLYHLTQDNLNYST